MNKLRQLWTFVGLLISGLYFCSDNKKRPQDNQHLTLRFYRDISLPDMQQCFDSYGVGEKRDVVTNGCHNSQGNQYFRYDMKNLHIYHGPKRNDNCMEADPGTQSVYVTRCNFTKDAQKWKWGFVNETNINNWLTYGSRLVDDIEIADLSKLS